MHLSFVLLISLLATGVNQGEPLPAINLDGTWTTPNVPSPQDWVLMLERAKDYSHFR